MHPFPGKAVQLGAAQVPLGAAGTVGAILLIEESAASTDRPVKMGNDND